MCLLTYIVYFAQGLPETPAELPKDTITAKGQGIQIQRPRYEYSEKKDPLTYELTWQLLILFSLTQVDRGFLDPEIYIESLAVHYAKPTSDNPQLAIALVRISDKPLGSLFLPSYEVRYRPKGEEVVSGEVTNHDIEMQSLGVYREMIGVSMSPEQLVELLTSPLVRLTGNKGSKDYELTETDKKAVLWFVENNVPRGKKVVSAVRERLAALGKSDKN